MISLSSTALASSPTLRARQAPAQTQAAPVVVTAEPLTAFDLRFYERVAEGSDLSGRQLWRVRATLLRAEGMRWSDALSARCYLVPSSRVPGRVYEVDLTTGTCSYQECGRHHICPDRLYNRKTSCTHIKASLAKEYLYERGD